MYRRRHIYWRRDEQGGGIKMGCNMPMKAEQTVMGRGWIGPAVVKSLFFAAAVAAAPSARAEAPPVDSDAIQEIVVTAAKRSESLQTVPISVTALTSGQLAQVKLDSPSDLVTQVPNLQVNGIVGEGSPLFS